MEKKRGRPVGSKNKAKLPNERIVMRPVVDQNTRYLNDEGVLYEQKTFYSFKSRIPGLIHIPGDNGETKTIEGNSIRDDITPREREAIIHSGAYKEGLIVEWNVESVEDSSSYNALNDAQMDKLCEAFLKNGDKEKLYNHIRNMDSLFALKLLNEKLVERNLPASAVKYCEGRIAEIEEEEIKKDVAPDLE